MANEAEFVSFMYASSLLVMSGNIKDGERGGVSFIHVRQLIISDVT